MPTASCYALLILLKLLKGKSLVLKSLLEIISFEIKYKWKKQDLSFLHVTWLINVTYIFPYGQNILDGMGILFAQKTLFKRLRKPENPDRQPLSCHMSSGCGSGQQEMWCTIQVPS